MPLSMIMSYGENDMEKFDTEKQPDAGSLSGEKAVEVSGDGTKVSPENACGKCVRSGMRAPVEYVKKPGHQWYVLRATYGRNALAVEEFARREIPTYTPMCMCEHSRKGERKRVKRPLMPGLIFAYSTRDVLKDLLGNSDQASLYIRFYRNRTLPVEPTTGKHPPLVVPDRDMQSFMLITTSGNEHFMVIEPSLCHFKSGDMVRIVRGQFEGVVGKVVRAAGQQRVAVSIDGLCTLVTAYVPTAFMERMEE